MRLQTLCATILLISALLLFSVIIPADAAARPDNSLYQELLSRHLAGDTVDYSGLKEDEALLDRYLESIAKTDPTPLARNEQLALYINAYNAYTLKLILDNFKNNAPPKSIRSIGWLPGSAWKIKFCVIGGTPYTLDAIEHEIIRPTFQDPRVHFAVNCASKSCPPLLAKPYEADTLDQQLTANTTAFLHDRRHNFLDGSTLHVSSIFKWFKKDFNEDVPGFFMRYTTGDLQAAIAQQRQTLTIKYLDYDWSLNGKPQGLQK